MADEQAKKDADAVEDDASEQSKPDDDTNTQTPLDEKGQPEKNR